MFTRCCCFFFLCSYNSSKVRGDLVFTKIISEQNERTSLFHFNHFVSGLCRIVRTNVRENFKGIFEWISIHIQHENLIENKNAFKHMRACITHTHHRTMKNPNTCIVCMYLRHLVRGFCHDMHYNSHTILAFQCNSLCVQCAFGVLLAFFSFSHMLWHVCVCTVCACGML